MKTEESEGTFDSVRVNKKRNNPDSKNFKKWKSTRRRFISSSDALPIELLKKRRPKIEESIHLLKF